MQTCQPPPFSPSSSWSPSPCPPSLSFFLPLFFSSFLPSLAAVREISFRVQSLAVFGWLRILPVQKRSRQMLLMELTQMLKSHRFCRMCELKCQSKDKLQNRIVACLNNSSTMSIIIVLIIQVMIQKYKYGAKKALLPNHQSLFYCALVLNILSYISNINLSICVGLDYYLYRLTRQALTGLGGWDQVSGIPASTLLKRLPAHFAGRHPPRPDHQSMGGKWLELSPNQSECGEVSCLMPGSIWRQLED